MQHDVREAQMCRAYFKFFFFVFWGPKKGVHKLCESFQNMSSVMSMKVMANNILFSNHIPLILIEKSADYNLNTGSSKKAANQNKRR